MKSPLTTIFGIMAAIGAAVVGGIQTGLIDATTLPAWIKGVAGLLSVVGAAGMGLAARDHGVSDEAADAHKTSGTSGFMGIGLALFALCFSLLLILAAGFLTGCAGKKIIGDPIVVRCEQAEAIGYATFDTFLKLDDSDREFAKTHALGAHEFAEYLREPVTIDKVNTLPRGVSYIKSLDTVKLSYKSHVASSNDVITALATLDTAVRQAEQYIGDLNKR